VKHLLIAIVVALAGSAHGVSIDDDAGTYGFSFLKVQSGAQAMALGGAGVAAQGFSSPNPASSASLEGPAVELSHLRLLSTVSHSALAASLPMAAGNLGVSLRFQSSGDIPLRGADPSLPWNGVPSSEPDGTYGVYDAAASIGYARSLSGMDVGVAASYVYEKIYVSSAHAFAMSFGAQKRFGNLQVGAAVRNVGVASAMEDESESVPWDAIVGIAHEAELAGVALRGLADFRYAPDYHETVHVGVEAAPVDALVLRAGFQRGIASGTDDATLSFGAAFRIGHAEFGYAYRPGPEGLGARHALTVSYAGAGGALSHAGT